MGCDRRCHRERDCASSLGRCHFCSRRDSAAPSASGHRAPGRAIVIARAPLRLSLAGAGTDLEAYYRKYGGAAVTLTIDKYCYALVSPTQTREIEVTTSDFQGPIEVNGHSTDDDVRAARAVLSHFGIQRGFTVFLAPELPPYTGMATRTAGTVALIQAVAETVGRQLPAAEVAELACRVEIEELATPIGKQDAYATPLGGLNFIQFAGDGVQTERLELETDLLASLEARLMIFFTGRYQRTSGVLAEHKRATNANRATVIKALREIRSAAVAMRHSLSCGDLDAVGAGMNETRIATRHLAPRMADAWIDQWCEMALSAGAAGVKPTGLGATGFLVVYCEPVAQERVTTSLAAAGLGRVNFRFDSKGAAVILNEHGARQAPIQGTAVGH
jgi:D-glycero-alpha-D-manno-heptose-7-phosphate kinase